jgi:phosphatidylserine decarboxylase
MPPDSNARNSVTGTTTRIAAAGLAAAAPTRRGMSRFPLMTNEPQALEVRRRAGWLPAEQDDLESWLEGHRERVEGKGEQVALHPVLVEFQNLIDTDPVVGMYVNQMIAQVPSGKPYRDRHLHSVQQLMRLINEVLTMAPEFGAQTVTLPLGAILDWTMGTPAGFAAFRDPRVNAWLKKLLTAWCEFLDSADSLYVLNDSPSGWKSADAQRAVGMGQYEPTRRTSTGASGRGTTSSPAASQTAHVPWPHPTTTR